MNKINKEYEFLKEEYEFCVKEFEKSFEEFIKDGLKEAEELAYAPWEEKSVEELQREFISEAIEVYERDKKYYYQKGIKISKKINEIDRLKELLTKIKEEDIVETPHSVVLKQIRKNYILIEKHYYVKDEYNIWDYLQDADPENFLGFL